MTRFGDGVGIVKVQCPYCGERIELVLEPSAESQRYVEDCQVCCRPMDVHVAWSEKGVASVELRREDA